MPNVPGVAAPAGMMNPPPPVSPPASHVPSRPSATVSQASAARRSPTRSAVRCPAGRQGSHPRPLTSFSRTDPGPRHSSSVWRSLYGSDSSPHAHPSPCRQQRMHSLPQAQCQRCQLRLAVREALSVNPIAHALSVYGSPPTKLLATILLSTSPSGLPESVGVSTQPGILVTFPAAQPGRRPPISPVARQEQPDRPHRNALRC